MGRGKGDTNVESRLFMPDFVRQNKDCGTISDSTYENQMKSIKQNLI
jgi:hypothetical protein